MVSLAKPNAVDKALRILDFLIGQPEGLRPAELTRLTGYPPGTLHRLLGTLARNGFVRQDEATGRYVLGNKFVQAFSGMVRGLGLQERALPYLRALTEATGLASNLGVLRGDQMVFLESLVGNGAGAVMYSPPGTLAPPQCTAMGKAMLAGLPEADLERYVCALSFAPRTPKSIASPPALLDTLAEVRQCGYAIDDEEYNLGVRCVAAAVRDYLGQVVAALSVSAPVHQLPPDRILEVAEVVIRAAAGMSVDMGYEASVREIEIRPVPVVSR